MSEFISAMSGVMTTAFIVGFCVGLLLTTFNKFGEKI